MHAHTCICMANAWIHEICSELLKDLLKDHGQCLNINGHTRSPKHSTIYVHENMRTQNTNICPCFIFNRSPFHAFKQLFKNYHRQAITSVLQDKHGQMHDSDLPLASHELLWQSFHLFSFSSYGHPSGSISIPSDQKEKVNHLKQSHAKWGSAWGGYLIKQRNAYIIP